MSTRQSNKKRNRNPQLVSRTHEVPRGVLIDIFRSNSMRTVKDIRGGIVNEIDIDKLQNFLQVSFALMQIVSVETFRQAQRNAEIAGFIYGEDQAVVLDPKKQAVIKDELAKLDQETTECIAPALDQLFTTPGLKS